MRISKPAALFLVLLTTGSVVAQTNLPQSTAPPPTPEQTETASIYITAATKKGMAIKDLKLEDLTITEDKIPAKIEKVTCGKPEPLLVGILADSSGSRRSDAHLLEHYDALEGFLHTLLASDDGTYIVAYDDYVHKLSEIVADSANISAAFDKLRKHQPRGSTALYDAIKAAAGADFKGRSGHRILVVVGDWEDNSSHVVSDEALKAAQRAATTVYAIVDFDSGVDSKKAYKRAVEVATRVTEETGGFAYVAKERDGFARALQAIGGAITSSCRLSYVTALHPDTKKGVKLHVQANWQDISILYSRMRFSASQ